MGADRKNVHDLLEKVGATKVRHNKHAVWELPNGRRVTVPTTPSDPQSWSKTYSRIQKLANPSQEENPAAETKPESKKKPRASKQAKQLKIMLPKESVPPKQDLKAQLKSVLPKIKPKPIAPPPPPKPAPKPKPDPAMEFQRVMLQTGVTRKTWEK